MFEAFGHFLMKAGLPCVVLTQVPHGLRNILNSKSQSTGEDGATDPEDSHATPGEHAIAFGEFTVMTSIGEALVEGILFPMSALGVNGQRTAIELISLTATRTIEESKHSVSFDPLGALAGWKLTPRPAETATSH